MYVFDIDVGHSQVQFSSQQPKFVHKLALDMLKPVALHVCTTAGESDRVDIEQMH